MENHSFRLFVVEDNYAEVRLIHEAIREAALTPMVSLQFAADGEKAIEMLDEMVIAGNIPHMVLLDLNIPKLNGKKVLTKIKTDPVLMSVPVFIITNSDYRKDMIECYQLKADGYLQKPTDFKRFVDFFISMKRSIEIKQRLSVMYIEKVYTELIAA